LLEIKYPFFKKGRVLKIETLENLRDFPRNVLGVYNEHMSDGVVRGFTPVVDSHIITFSKGVLKHNGRLYLVDGSTAISYAEDDITAAIKLNFYDESDSGDFRTTFAEIGLDEDMTIAPNQVELGRFKLKAGAYLRSAYQGLYDFVTEYNTINIVNVPYSGYKEHTISHDILKFFAKEALEANTQNAMDIAFCLTCLNSERIERQVILSYITYRSEKPARPLTNMDIHGRLVKILDAIKRESGRKVSHASGRPKIFVD
jgi:hypothetical protein